MKDLSRRYDISPDGCDAAKRLPPSALVADIISLAVSHADSLGVGYSAMKPLGIMWVMGRLSIEVTRWPAMFDTFELTTWVEGVNRLFSERDFEVKVNGSISGYARTVWSAIDMATRRSASLTPVIESLGDAADPDRPCPIAKVPRLAAPESPSSVRSYLFGLSDLDFNRHVTTTRYVDLIMDCVPLTLYDTHRLLRFDIVFHHEARYGDEVEVINSIEPASKADNITVKAAIVKGGDRAIILTAASITLIPVN
ncbi:MAG: thioesterase [Pseudoflavonifractor sp.]|nr:thioesterase [Alloprevotella sp.]MCM1116722.1 thioesterase [Pseudoflavonifractor sp.]